MLKPKDLAKMSDNELSDAYGQACRTLTEQLDVLPHDPDHESAWYDETEAAWLDVKRCHQQLVLRRGREWASRPLEEIMEDLHGAKK